MTKAFAWVVYAISEADATKESTGYKNLNRCLQRFEQPLMVVAATKLS